MTRSSSADHQANRLAVLRAVAMATFFAAGGEPYWGAPVDRVAYELGKTRRDLLNSRRERLMSELRRDGLIVYEIGVHGPAWKPTAAGFDLLASEAARSEEERA